jgi:hypothetical protein
VAVSLFPSERSWPSRTSSVVVFTDPACRVPASISAPGGGPLPGSKVDIGPDGRIPLFQGPPGATALYCRDANGIVVALYPHPSASATAVTGSKGGNSALASLIAALAAEGLIIDQTT